MSSFLLLRIISQTDTWSLIRSLASPSAQPRYAELLVENAAGRRCPFCIKVQSLARQEGDDDGWVFYGYLPVEDLPSGSKPMCEGRLSTRLPEGEMRVYFV